jgi:hypothetical protein
MLRRLWGVHRMGNSLRDRCCSAARALLLSGLFALAWLIWGAGTADAAPTDPGSGLGPGPVILREDGRPEPGPAASLRLADTLVPAAPLEEATAVAAEAGMADVVFAVAASALTTVATSATPVLAEAAVVIDPVSDALPVTLPGSLVLPTTPLTEITDQRAGQNTGPAPAPAAAALSLATAGGAQRTAGPELTPAQPRVSATTVPAVPAMQPAAEYLASPSPSDAPPNPEDLLWLSALQGPSGSASSGPGGGGAQAAGEAAGFWKSWHAPRGARTPDVAQAPATPPSFDPGSSPD